MKRTKFTVDFANKIASLKMSLNSLACERDGGFTDSEIEHIKEELEKIRMYISKNI